MFRFEILKLLLFSNRLGILVGPLLMMAYAAVSLSAPVSGKPGASLLAPPTRVVENRQTEMSG